MRKDDVEELRRMRLRWRTDPKTGPTLCVSLAVQTHLDISQEPFLRKFTGRMLRTSWNPDQAPAFTLTVRTPQCAHSVCGQKNRLPLPA